MQTHFEQELAGLKAKLLTMASHAEKSVRLGVEALMQRDASLAQRVRDDDEVLDAFEIEIDNMAIKLLAKAPLASDLRLITVAMKISQNLERVGDEASKIAKRTAELVQQPPLTEVASIPAISSLALEQLKAALDCFVNADSAKAREIIPRDREIDSLNKEIYRDIAARMTEDGTTVERGLSLIVVAKCLERIGDHAKNVAEEVVYLCEAEDIRHTNRVPDQYRQKKP